MTDEERIFSAADLAERLDGRLVGNGATRCRGINTVEDAGPDEITFITDDHYARRWGTAQAGAAIITEGLNATGHDPERRALIFVANAHLATAEILDLFRPADIVPEPGRHPTASVHETAQVAGDARIGPHVSIDRGCVVASDVVLHAGVRLYAGVAIGSGSILHANTVVRERCRIGRRVILHQNVSIGADGFGYRPAPDGSGLVKMPHIGTVILEDEVEIGPGSCVDRGKFGATVVGAGTKIDNLVQVGHNCRIGRSCVVAAGTMLAGSVSVGDGVQIGGGVGVSEHVRIGHGASLAAMSGVMHDLPDGAAWGGVPAGPIRDMLRQWAAIRKLPDLIKRIPG